MWSKEALIRPIRPASVTLPCCQRMSAEVDVEADGSAAPQSPKTAFAGLERIYLC